MEIDFISNILKEDKNIYVNLIQAETKKAIIELGGIKKASEELNWSYSKTKEICSRKPISVHDLKKLMKYANNKEITKEILEKATVFSCKKSKTKIIFPKELTKEIAYIAGIILGDGSLSCDKSNKDGNWRLAVFFDNKEHQRIYDKIFYKIFGLKQKHYLKTKNCFESYVNSKVIHWFFRGQFEITNGFKANKIKTPLIIKKSSKNIKTAFLQGLFDSDGTITKSNELRFSTTSKQMAKEAKEMLTNIGINPGINVWIKDQKFLPLYTLRIPKKEHLLFEKEIGFRHPLKKLLLKKFNNSPFV